MNRTKQAVPFIVIYFLFFCIDFVYAQESYRTEFSAGFSNARNKDDIDTTIYSTQARIHFAPVNTSNHPLAETAFLERIGSIALFGGYGESEGSLFKSKGPFYGASVTFMKPRMPIVISAKYTRTEIDFELQGQEDRERKVDSYLLGIGYFFKPALLGEIQYAHTENDTTIPIFSFESIRKNDYYGLAAKFVKELPDSTAYNISGTAGVSRFDNDGDRGSNMIVTVSGDYYFNRRISVGAGYALNAGDDKDAEGNMISIRFNAFFNQHFSVNAGVAKFFAENPEGVDRECFNAGITIRL